MKHSTRLLATAGFLAAAVASAHAIPYINVAGNTTGSFTLNPGSGTGLSFVGGSFNTIVLADGSTATSLGNSANTTVDSLGLFRLANVAGSPDNYNGTFSMTLTFTIPTVSPTSATYTAILTGAVTTIGANGSSTVRITFDDTDGDIAGDGALMVHKNFTYYDASTGLSGTLDLGLNRQYNLGYPGNATGSQSQLGVSGDLRATATPGPGALASFGVGLLGAARRRRRPTR